MTIHPEPFAPPPPPAPLAPGQTVPSGTPVPVVLPPEPVAPPTPPQPTFTQEDVERIRAEEKAKLYPTLEEQKRRLAEFEAKEKEAADAAAAEQARLEEEQRKAREEEMSAKELIESRDREWEQKLLDMRRELDQEKALREKEAQFSDLIQYRTGRLAQEADAIEPRLLDFVRGNTREEIDASIEIVKAKTAEIAADIEASLQQAPRVPQLPVSGSPPIDMAALPTEGQRSFSPEDIRNMSMEDYMRLRPQMLQATSQRVREGGLYTP